MFAIEIIDKAKHLEGAMNSAAYNLATCVAENRCSEDIDMWANEFKKHQKKYHDFLNKNFK